ncbi:MAG TPA: RagB/SusD family nutrient uptake outer membrane protein [Gemmatimonadaceae bacterium]|nr:RagB/SusD family nutrient uptake outer membrane protein [Gemmatimonadaceae bacterium]
MRTLVAISLASLIGAGLTGCDLNVANPNVIDASKFNPNTDGFTLSMSAQTNLFQGFQAVALWGGTIADEIWTGAIHPQTLHINSRNFTGADDINADIFGIISLAVANNSNAVRALAGGSGAASDSNYARVSMNLGYAFELMAEIMCASDVQKGPKLTDTQLLDSAVTHFQKAITVATAASNPAMIQESQVGLARAYLQLGQNASAVTAAGQVDPGFVAYEINSPTPALSATLGNIMVVTQNLGQLVVPQLYRDLSDPRVGVDSTSGCNTTSGTPCIVQTKYTSYGDPIRLASGLEAQFIAAEAQLHASGATGPALTLIASERTAGNQPPYSGPTDPQSVLTELLNQRAREFWMEGKKLGDIRRNPTVSLAAILTDPVGAPFFGATGGTFGSNFCAPIPPEEIDANPNLQ